MCFGWAVVFFGWIQNDSTMVTHYETTEFGRILFWYFFLLHRTCKSKGTADGFYMMVLVLASNIFLFFCPVKLGGNDFYFEE